MSVGIIWVLFQVLFKKGITLERRGDIYIPAHEDGYEIKTDIDGSILTIADAPWPGFTPDLLSIVLVVATQKEMF
jgi:UDP-N-acetylglucosamine 1-carboxyvinyltransferase